MSPQGIIIILASLMEGVISMTFNACIIVIYSKSIKASSKRKLSEVIQLVMGLLNISTTCSNTAQILLGVFWPLVIYNRWVFSNLAYVQLFHTCFNFWLTACLCMHYCTSIASFRNRIFIWMKRAFLSYLPHLLLFSGLGTCVMTFPLVFTFQIIPQQLHAGNSTTVDSLVSYNVFQQVVLIMFGCVLPFAFTCFSVIATASSLVIHIQRMKQNKLTQPMLEVHLNALRTMFLFLILSVLYLTAEAMVYAQHTLDNPIIFIGWLMITIFPIAEALIIIQASPKLWKTLLRKFRSLVGNET